MWHRVIESKVVRGDPACANPLCYCMRAGKPPETHPSKQNQEREPEGESGGAGGASSAGERREEEEAEERGDGERHGVAVVVRDAATGVVASLGSAVLGVLQGLAGATGGGRGKEEGGEGGVVGGTGSSDEAPGVDLAPAGLERAPDASSLPPGEVTRARRCVADLRSGRAAELWSTKGGESVAHVGAQVPRWRRQTRRWRPAPSASRRCGPAAAAAGRAAGTRQWTCRTRAPRSC